MRILGFQKKWDKLNQDIFTTFRFVRRDRDWGVEEVVQIVYKPRSKEREILGIARIIRKQEKDLNKRWCFYPLPSFPNTPDMITPEEAYADGFPGIHRGGDVEGMYKFFLEAYGYSRCHKELMNKLTLYWIERFNA